MDKFYSINQLQAFRIVELKEILRSFHLSTTGNKAELINKILDHYQSMLNHEITQNQLEITQLENDLRAISTSTPTSRTNHASSAFVKTNDSLTERNIRKQHEACEQKTPCSSNVHVPAQNLNSKSLESIASILESIACNMNYRQLPPIQPSKFSGGDITKYKDWRRTFMNLLNKHSSMPTSDKFHYLGEFTSGPAHELVSGYSSLNSNSAFSDAMTALDERYGNSFQIAQAYRKRLKDWPKISAKDSIGLQKFTDFLKQCRSAMSEISQLNILDDCEQNQSILRILPDYIVLSWNKLVTEQMIHDSERFPSFSTFVTFMEKQSKLANNPISSLEAVRNKHQATPLCKPVTTSRPLFSNKTHAESFQCVHCLEKDHKYLTQCAAFKELDSKDRIAVVKNHNLCFRCLNPGHTVIQCTKDWKCKSCQLSNHHTLLHLKKSSQIVNSTCSKTNTSHEHKIAEPFSMTVPVWVSTTDNPREEILTYALLDTQSNTTFILEQTARKLNTTSSIAKLQLSTMTSQHKQISCNRYTNLQVRGYNSTEYVTLPHTFSREVIPYSEAGIASAENIDNLPHLSSIKHMIPPRLDCDVGLLIGCDCIKALTPLEIKSNQNSDLAFAVKTTLGWSVVGPSSSAVLDKHTLHDQIGVTNKIVTLHSKHVPHETLKPHDHITVSLQTRVDDITLSDLYMNIEGSHDFHIQEKHMSQDDLRFINLLDKSIVQNSEGYYSMPLPFKQPPTFPNNYTAVLRRFKSLNMKFMHDDHYKKEYSELVQGMIERHEAEIVPASELNKPCWYLPHHGVRHKTKKKLRVVFDCSAQYDGQSLNDNLLQGPDLNNSLLGVLLRFRQHPIALSCDIEKMYHRFLVSPEHRDFMRFLWFNEAGEITPYRMCVHIFGARSSPNCAKFALNKIADDHAAHLPKVHQFIQKNFYVDDGLTSVETVDEAVDLIQNTMKACKPAQVRIHKVLSNNVDVIKALPASEVAIDLSQLEIKSVDERALGITWCLNSDSLKYNYNFENNSPCTKRKILSSIACIFDPMGLIAPYSLQGKVLLQHACRSGLSWDDQLDESCSNQWNAWCSDMKNLMQIQIPRCITATNMSTIARYEVHTFSDASQIGYGACSYLRAVSINNEVHCSLLYAKSKVAPLKPTTIPRLELQAALLAAKLNHTLQHELDISFTAFLYTDSKIVLGYLNNDEKRFHTFVANRLAQIHSLCHKTQWNYVPSKENPADISSRGFSKGIIPETSIWFKGPDFLWDTEFTTETIMNIQISADDPEVKRQKTVLVTKCEQTTTCHDFIIETIESFSDWTKAIHVLTLVRNAAFSRFGKLMQHSLSLSCTSIQDATTSVLKALQSKYFHDEINHLRTHNEVGIASKLKSLNCFIDESGLLRVGGRLKHAEHLSFQMKHPIILPGKSCHITQMIINHYHKLLHHQGRTATMSAIRSAGFWIINLNSCVSSFIFRCVQCRKLRKPPAMQKMADLPPDRTTPTPAFTHIGLDCFGPFEVKDYRKTVKRYAAIFTCLSSRAVHVEVLKDMTTDSFINSLRCFIALRGNIKSIRCDNGTNLVGARNELRKSLDELACDDRVKQFLIKHHCEFIFNPPQASHMGGAWERLIRSIRSVFNSMMCHTSMLDTFSLRTVLYECMAIVNSRPLTAIEPEIAPLSPNDLLHMKTSVIVPVPGNFDDQSSLYSIKQWKRVQYLANVFWSRWSKEYLNQLQNRSKWHHKVASLAVNDIVLVKDECNRILWKLGKITKIIPSHDGLVRKAMVQCFDHSNNRHYIIQRPANKLVVLIEA